MAFFEGDRVREIFLGDTSDTTQNTLVNAKGAEADQKISDWLYITANKYGKSQALSAVDITNGQIGGSAAPQHIKDASSNLGAALCFYKIGNKDMGDKYYELAKSTIDGYIIRLESESEIYSANG
jgi:hypothetical protein